MRLRPDQLERHLAQPLKPIYIISGEEPLQREESLDALRAAARAQGYDERVVYHADRRFDWGELSHFADSLSLLRQTAELVRENGGEPIQVDCTVYLEAPRVTPHVEAMRENLAGALGIPPGQVSVKATTTDGLGFVGREEGAAASAVLLVRTGGS